MRRFHEAVSRTCGCLPRHARGKSCAAFVVAAVMLGGCAQREPAEPTAAQAPALNEAPATATGGTPVDPTPLREKLEPDDPAAGMNNRRPDSQKDIEPDPGASQPAP